MTSCLVLIGIAIIVCYEYWDALLNRWVSLRSTHPTDELWLYKFLVGLSVAQPNAKRSGYFNLSNLLQL